MWRASTGAAVVHVSTCFVAGQRDGEVWEDEPLVGYFPRKDRGDGTQTDALRDDDFSVDAEIADCQRIIEQVKRARRRSRARLGVPRARRRALRDEGRDPDDERTLKIAVQRERKIWMAEQLTELGMERAQHWGWTNTYTYTKSLGEQIMRGGRATCARLIVRPGDRRVGGALSVPGLERGLHHHRAADVPGAQGAPQYPAGDKATLDVIPVDLVAAGMILATAATIAGENEPVYQLGSSRRESALHEARASSCSGCTSAATSSERSDRAKARSCSTALLARLEPVPVSHERFDAASAPLLKRARRRR